MFPNLNRLTMKSKLVLVIMIFSVLFSCQQKEVAQNNSQNDTLNSQVIDEHNAKNSLDYIGTYKGILPCADCEGLETTIILNENDTYCVKSKYLGKGDKVFEKKGTFSWNKSGNTIILNDMENAPKFYFVGENTLTQLDLEGKKIKGNLAEEYILSKQPDTNSDIETAEVANQPTVNLNDRIESKTVIKTGNPAVGKFTLAETKWKLVELNGKPVKQIGNKDYFLKLNSKDGRFSAYAGCNNLMGSYVMKTTFSLSFSGVASTMMACTNMDLEQKFGAMLEKVDNYVIVENKLQLNKARMAPLARFEAVK
jgi:copper homeostasis protein (lipoprotein)